MLRLKYPRGIEWQVNGPETHKLYDASSYTIHLNLHQRVRRKINGGGTGLGRVLWECGEAVRPGRAGKWVQRPPSWRLILQYCSGPEMVVRDFGTTGGARPILILPPHTWPREVKTSTNCGGVWDHKRAWRPPRPCPPPPARSLHCAALTARREWVAGGTARLRWGAGGPPCGSNVFTLMQSKELLSFCLGLHSKVLGPVLAQIGPKKSWKRPPAWAPLDTN
jgi:hypothetical protein